MSMSPDDEFSYEEYIVQAFSLSSLKGLTIYLPPRRRLEVEAVDYFQHLMTTRTEVLSGHSRFRSFALNLVQRWDVVN